MTAPKPTGCSGCGSRDTVTVDAVHGRRCAACAPVFDAAQAVELMRAGWSAAAIAYTRIPMPAEVTA